jgi:hypothetical protein
MIPTLGWTAPTDADHFGSYPSTVLDDVIELPILLPEWQVVALEEAARDRGMTIGQLIRKLFADLFPRAAAE